MVGAPRAPAPTTTVINTVVQAPPQQYAPPPHQYAPPPQQYGAPPQQYGGQAGGYGSHSGVPSYAPPGGGYARGGYSDTPPAQGSATPVVPPAGY